MIFWGWLLVAGYVGLLVGGALGRITAIGRTRRGK